MSQKITKYLTIKLDKETKKTDWFSMARRNRKGKP